MRNTKFVFEGDGSWGYGSWEVWRFPGCPVASAEPSRSIGLSGCPVVELSGYPVVQLSGFPVVQLSKERVQLLEKQDSRCLP